MDGNAAEMKNNMEGDQQIAPQATVIHGTDSLWTIADCAKFLRKSPRWVWSAISISPDCPGSIPFVRVGVSPRFLPAHVKRWVLDGCPPAATLRDWIEAKEKRRKVG